MSESNLQDRAAIHDLFTRYCCALDNGEVETVVDCFTVDAILKSPVIDVSGHHEIRSFANRLVAQRAAGTQFRHMVCNIAVMITGNRGSASEGRSQPPPAPSAWSFKAQHPALRWTELSDRLGVRDPAFEPVSNLFSPLA